MLWHLPLPHSKYFGPILYCGTVKCLGSLSKLVEDFGKDREGGSGLLDEDGSLSKVADWLVRLETQSGRLGRCGFIIPSVVPGGSSCHGMVMSKAGLLIILGERIMEKERV